MILTRMLAKGLDLKEWDFTYNNKTNNSIVVIVIITISRGPMPLQKCGKWETQARTANFLHNSLLYLQISS